MRKYPLETGIRKVNKTVTPVLSFRGLLITKPVRNVVIASGGYSAVSKSSMQRKLTGDGSRRKGDRLSLACTLPPFTFRGPTLRHSGDGASTPEWAESCESGVGDV